MTVNKLVREIIKPTIIDLETSKVLKLTEQIINEGGFAFDNVSDVPSSKARSIFKEYIILLSKSKLIDIDKVVGIGSSRQILQKLPGAKQVSGDIDLLGVTTSKKDSVKDVSRKLVRFFEQKGIESKSFFGNIVSVSFPSKAYTKNNVQIDLMIAVPSPKDRVYKYLRDLKFFSAEDYREDTPLVIKGAHRAELIRFLTKAVGLGFGPKGIFAFRWNNKYKNVKDLIKDIEEKIKRMRKQEYKEIMTQFVGFFSKYKTMQKIQVLLVNKETGYIKNKYAIGKYSDDIVIKVIIELLFERVELSEEKDWEDILKQALDIKGNVLSQLATFDKAIDFIEQLRKKGKVKDKMLIHVFNGYKRHIKRLKGDLWTDAFEDYLISKFSFLKGKLKEDISDVQQYVQFIISE
jgi:hypothetical protein